MRRRRWGTLGVVSLLASITLTLGPAAQEQDASGTDATSKASGDDQSGVANGERLFHLGGCASCHTAEEGASLAGGDALQTPFGTFYAPNITPHEDAGIGGWSDGDFIDAMRHGRSPDGWPYYPSFPYTSYVNATDEDLRDLKAYIDTVEPSANEAPGHELPFPYNIRWGLYVWQWLFTDAGVYERDESKSEAWNTGAYLTLGMGHCAQCHTPRTWYGAVSTSRMWQGGELGGETVPSIDDTEAGIGGWSQGDVVTLLQLGMTPDGDFVGGEMGKVVTNVSELPEDDLRAMAEYLLQSSLTE